LHALFERPDALISHHNGLIMASRIFALLIWAAVAASLAFWGLRWLAPPTGVPANAVAVSLDNAGRGDLRRLISGPAVSASAVPAQSGASELAGRIKLIGVVAPKAGQHNGVALLSIDGKPARAIRLGGVVDGELLLLGLTQRGAEIGPTGGPSALTLDLPLLPPPAMGALPPVAGLERLNSQPRVGIEGQPLAPGANRTPNAARGSLSTPESGGSGNGQFGQPPEGNMGGQPNRGQAPGTPPA
jgi:general secretion pathway protein C